MPVDTTRLSLVRTARWRPEYELRQNGRPLGRLRWGASPGSVTAVVGDRTWTLTPGPGRSTVEAEEVGGDGRASLRDGAIVLAGETRPVVHWRRNRTKGTCAELEGAGCSVALRVRRRTVPGLDVEIDGDLVERELLLLLAGYDLLR